MQFEKLILNIVLWIIDKLTFFIRPHKNRITFISMTSDHLNQDFLEIHTLLEQEGKYDLRTNLMTIHKGIKGYFFYFINLCSQMIQMKQSALVILNDNNYIVSFFKPKQTKVLQIWHACGAIKKFGNQIDRSYAVKGYDAVISGAVSWKKAYSEAFGVTEEQVYPTGMPRIDALLDEQKQLLNKEAFLKRNPVCRNRNCILYAPTFRGNMVKGFERASFDLVKVLDALGDEFCILYKFHPLLKDIRIDHPRAIDCHNEELYTLMHVSDVLISDYSSVILDYSLLNKPMIAYTDDLDEYEKTIGLNIDFRNEFPGEICTDEEELIAALTKEPDTARIDAFQKKYIEHKDGLNTKRVVKLIQQLLS